MNFKFEKTEYGTATTIELTGNEVATAIDDWLKAHDVNVRGPRTIKVNDELCSTGTIYVDPAGHVILGSDKDDDDH